MATLELVRESQAALDALAAVASQDLLDVVEAAARFPAGSALLDEFIWETVPAIIEAHAPDAAALGAELYEESRLAAGLPGRAAVVADTVPDEVIRRNIGWALTGADSLAVLMRLSGVSLRLIRQAHRDTVKLSTSADPDAVGIIRVARPDACWFCLMLASRGAEHVDLHGNAEADRWHTNCRCTPTPSYGPGYDDMPDPDVLYAEYLRVVDGAPDRAAAWRAHIESKRA